MDVLLGMSNLLVRWILRWGWRILRNGGSLVMGEGDFGNAPLWTTIVFQVLKVLLKIQQLVLLIFIVLN